MNSLELFTNGKVVTKDGREFTRLVGGFGEGKPVISDKQVAELLGYKKGAREVRDRVAKNLKHFTNGIHIKDLKSEVLQNDTFIDTLISLGYAKQSITQAKNIYIFSLEGFLLFLSIVEVNNDYTSFIQDYFQVDKTMITTVVPMKYETSFSKILEVIFKDVLEFKPQFYCCGKYFIDFYEPRYNLAIEYDEEQHNHQQYEDKLRQEEIKQVLKCDFIRVKKGQELQGINNIIKYIIDNKNKGVL